MKTVGEIEAELERSNKKTPVFWKSLVVGFVLGWVFSALTIE